MDYHLSPVPNIVKGNNRQRANKNRVLPIPTTERVQAVCLYLRRPGSHANSRGYRELATALGVHINTVQNWATGKTSPADHMLEDIDSVAWKAGYRKNRVN